MCIRVYGGSYYYELRKKKTMWILATNKKLNLAIMRTVLTFSSKTNDFDWMVSFFYDPIEIM